MLRHTLLLSIRDPSKKSLPYQMEVIHILPLPRLVSTPLFHMNTMQFNSFFKKWLRWLGLLCRTNIYPLIRAMNKIWNMNFVKLAQAINLPFTFHYYSINPYKYNTMQSLFYKVVKVIRFFCKTNIYQFTCYEQIMKYKFCQTCASYQLTHLPFIFHYYPINPYKYNAMQSFF